VKRNVDHRIKIGSSIVNFFVFYKNAHDDDDTSQHNLSNYTQDGSPEVPHYTWVLLEEKKA
jgi:hypothetical protein